MDKFLVIFFVENQFLQFSVEEIFQNLRNGVINRRLINVRQEIDFPIFEKEGAFYLNNTQLKFITHNANEQKNIIKLKHGDFFSVVDSKNPYQILWVSKIHLSVNMKTIAMPRQGKIVIGRSVDSNIVIDINASVSRHHALIKIVNGEATIEDTSGKAGVYLNGKKIVASRLKCGDIIFVMGYSFVYMNQILMIPENLSVNQLELTSLDEKVAVRREKQIVLFERTPRIYKSLITEPVIIDSPPQRQERKQLPFILAAGPSLTMSLAMMAQLGITISKVHETGNYTSVITSGIMVASLLAGAVLWPFLSREYYKKQDKIAEDYRISRYQDYLAEKKEILEKSQEYNRWIWNVEYYPSILEMLDFASNRSRRLWEKSPSDQDFLNVRLGVGEKHSEIPIKVPEKHFSLYDDELLEQTYLLEETHRKIKDVPITVSLTERKVVGIVGDREKINKMIWCMAVSLTVMHSPDEVKIGFIGDKSQLIDFEWLLQLPHIRSSHSKIRFFATNSIEIHNLLLYLEEEYQQATEIPYYVFFILNGQLTESDQLGKCSYLRGHFQNITTIYTEEYFSRIPKEAEVIILNDSEQSGIYRKNEDNNQFLKFIPDELYYLQVQQLIHSFSYLDRRFSENRFGIPDRISFLEMYQVGNVRMLNVCQRWSESRVSRSMAVPIGVKSDGELFSLDIHEKYHGCHGLVAGMTGSGKSEFLQEYILSLMVNYSPEDVAFILIDFKGDDMARPFLKAPHLAATISNLSGNMLYRARVSIEAETKKRQILFNETAQELGVDKLDINSWHKYIEEGKIRKKLPHLIIIIDEFAQLKTQQPDFLEYLINVAQVGRSLGVHLILATQKPNGVVSPQIWSNSRFRVCLKVLDQEDSKEMIRRGDAAGIKLPGRAYVQVGYDEVFEQVQTGYSGADYIENAKYLQVGEDSVEMLDYTGTVQRVAKRQMSGHKSGTSELEETVVEITRIAEKLNLKAEPLWKPLLKEIIYLEDCIGQACIFDKSLWDKDQDGKAICGLCDLPQKQIQKPFEVKLVQDGHIAIYGISGYGKTVFVQTLIFSLSLRYSPAMLQLFAIDFGGRTLGNLQEMPHCVAVAFEDEKEKIADIISQIMGQMEKRKKIFAEKECNTYSSYLNVTKSKLPMILLVIDNYSALRERMFQLEEFIVQLAANAKTYGIYLILTGNNRNAIYYKVSEHIGTRIVFQMSEKQHYRELLNCRTNLELEDIKGRALVKYEEIVAEMQAALPFNAINEAQMYSMIKRNYRLMHQAYPKKNILKYSEPQYKGMQEEIKNKYIFIPKGTVSSNEIPILPAVHKKEGYLVLGRSLRNGSYQGFSQDDTQRIFIGSEKNILSKNILTMFEQTTPLRRYLFSLNDKAENGWNLIQTEQEINEFVSQCESTKEKIFLIINDFSDFYDTISDDDLVILGKYLKSDAGKMLTIVTVGKFDRLEDYRDTGLYVNLVRCQKGMVINGKIDNKKVSMLYSELSKSSPEKRSEELKDGQAILYHGTQLAYITLEEWQ